MQHGRPPYSYYSDFGLKMILLFNRHISRILTGAGALICYVNDLIKETWP